MSENRCEGMLVFDATADPGEITSRLVELAHSVLLDRTGSDKIVHAEFDAKPDPSDGSITRQEKDRYFVIFAGEYGDRLWGSY